MKILTLLTCLIYSHFTLGGVTPSQRIKLLENNLEGKTFIATANMEVVKGKDIRKMRLNLWWKERKFALIKILEPQKDKGTGNLRVKTDLWQYLPKVNRIIRVPSSMMLQSWMGSDFSNDDLVKNGSLSSDYTHKLLGIDKKRKIEKIQCTPKPNAPVVWGKIIIVVQTMNNTPLRQEFYSEKGKLVKVLEGKDVRKFGKHNIPTVLKMTSMTNKDSSTTIRYEVKSVKFNSNIPDSFFTQEQLRKSNL